MIKNMKYKNFGESQLIAVSFLRIVTQAYTEEQYYPVNKNVTISI